MRKCSVVLLSNPYYTAPPILTEACFTLFCYFYSPPESKSLISLLFPYFSWGLKNKTKPKKKEKRPHIGSGGGQRLCGIIMESSWETCPLRGQSDSKEKFGLISDPSQEHLSVHSHCSAGCVWPLLHSFTIYGLGCY